MIRKGDIVIIKPEWRDPGDERFTWIARNDEKNGRVDISTVETQDWAIWPMQTVATDMLVTA